MKKLMILISFVLAGFFASGQEAPKFEQEAPKFVYCRILGQAKFLSKKINVTIDFGDKMKFFADHRLKDPKTGKARIFNSMVDALNYMGKRGWEFDQAYAFAVGNQNVYHYLMRKPFIDLDEETQMEVMK
jgi:hypothetical protein